MPDPAAAHRARSASGTCHLCRRSISRGYELLGGRICNPCYSRLRRHPGTCPSCGHIKVLAFHDATGAIVCTECAGVPARFACKSCGSEEQLTGSQCGPCRLTERAHTLLACADGTLHPDLTSLHAHLLSAPDKRSVIRWLKKEPIFETLRAMASGDLPISHDTINRIPPSRRVSYFRQLLVSAGTLSPIDVHLNDHEMRVDAFLASLPPAHAAVIGRYHRWHVLRVLRRKAEREPLRRSTTERCRRELRVISAYLSWLDTQGISLDAVHQPDLDYYVTNVATGDVPLKAFLNWAHANHLGSAVEMASRRPSTPASPMSVDELWTTVDRLAADETIEMTARIAGLFILLYAQSLATCVRLRQTDVTVTDSTVSVTFASDPIEMPPPVAQLVRRYLEAPARRAIYRTAESNWLFGGLLPTSHITEAHLSRILSNAGIAPRLAKEAAMRQLATALPARIVADTIGVSIGTASKWSRTSGGVWKDYPDLRQTQPE